jgi:hypothetical protein
MRRLPSIWSIGTSTSGSAVCRCRSRRCPRQEHPVRVGTGSIRIERLFTRLTQRASMVDKTISGSTSGTEKRKRKSKPYADLPTPWLARRLGKPPYDARYAADPLQQLPRHGRSSHRVRSRSRPRRFDGSIHAGLDVALGDLRSWHTLLTWCTKCSHATVKPQGPIRRYSRHALFSSVERALFYTSDQTAHPLFSFHGFAYEISCVGTLLHRLPRAWERRASTLTLVDRQQCCGHVSGRCFESIVIGCFGVTRMREKGRCPGARHC